MWTQDIWLWTPLKLQKTPTTYQKSLHLGGGVPNTCIIGLFTPQFFSLSSQIISIFSNSPPSGEAISILNNKSSLFTYTLIHTTWSLLPIDHGPCRLPQWASQWPVTGSLLMPTPPSCSPFSSRSNQEENASLGSQTLAFEGSFTLLVRLRAERLSFSQSVCTSILVKVKTPAFSQDGRRKGRKSGRVW